MRGLGVQGEDLARILGYTQDREVASLTQEQKMEIREEASRILKQSGGASSASIEPLVRVIARAVEVLGSSEKALRWVNAPVRSLGDLTPVSLLSTPDGIARVEDVLGRIERGVW
ncbi:MAG TPA: MbcA/ParS/Xre antitoxin family protein [Bryobacteraceae bacterium]|nr:MbcA/ParS/Xre antitoxin family protein [Bryobacteraceae bacterium]